MRVLLLGDIGWPHLYHLGDEAMTEVAIEMLRERGIDDITLVSAVPSVATQRYGVKAVERIGFSLSWSRNGLDGTLTKVTWALRDGYRGHEGVNAMLDAVSSSDAVVIAGGGNMNSQFVHHLFERCAVVRIAAHMHKPVFVTSQTVGPLRRVDEPLVKEILDAATCFGARDSATYDLLLNIGADPERVVRTMDDAILLTYGSEDIDAISKLNLTDRRIVVSIQMYSPDVPTSENEYYRNLASTFDELSNRYDADIALVPHAGSFDREVPKDDVVTHDAIASLSRSGRVIPQEMRTARQVLALTATALFSISTRYHPLVFGPLVNTPSFGIILNRFASIRMRGALANVGLESYALPLDVWSDGPFFDIIEEGCRAGFDEQVGRTVQRGREAQRAWWDAMVDVAQSGRWLRPSNVTEDSPRFVSPKYRDYLTTSHRLSERADHARLEAGWAQIDLRDERSRAGRNTKAIESDREFLRKRLEEVSQSREILDTENARLETKLASAEASIIRLNALAKSQQEAANLALADTQAEATRNRREVELLRSRKVVRWADRVARGLRRR